VLAQPYWLISLLLCVVAFASWVVGACAMAPERIECADGPVMLVRGELWHRIGGLTEESVMHSEDTDLYWKARKNGYGVWFERDAEFIHLGNASASRHFDSTSPGASSMALVRNVSASSNRFDSKAMYPRWASACA
jgi:GT2 family glycosyltransferase